MFINCSIYHCISRTKLNEKTLGMCVCCVLNLHLHIRSRTNLVPIYCYIVSNNKYISLYKRNSVDTMWWGGITNSLINFTLEKMLIYEWVTDKLSLL